jgi:hypothetical protein
LARAKRKRKRSKRAGAPAPPPRPSRSEQKDAIARAALEPLEAGERPTAVTVGAVVAGVLGVANVAFYVAGVEIQGSRPPITGVLFYTALMFVAAWGMWKARYWAVLGMEVLLGLVVLIFGVLLFAASNVGSALIALAIVGSAGSLFWSLVKAMARIQMPVRR